MFSSQIFDKLGDDKPYTTKTGNYFVGFAGFIGSLVALIPFKYLTRRVSFIGGHIAFMVCMTVIFVCIVYKQPIVVLIGFVAFIIIF